MARTVEVDEGDWNRMVALQGVASKIVANPQAKRLLEQAHKTVDPNAVTPLLDQEKATIEPLNAVKNELTAEIEKLRKEREDEKREQTLAALAKKQNDGLARLRRAGYTDEGIKQVETLMQEKGLLDVDDAVAIFERHNPPQVPATPGGGITGERWNFGAVEGESDKNIQALLTNKGDGSAADAAAMRMANEALAELRGARR
jgi:hypothetical protein